MPPTSAKEIFGRSSSGKSRGRPHRRPEAGRGDPRRQSRRFRGLSGLGIDAQLASETGVGRRRIVLDGLAVGVRGPIRLIRVQQQADVDAINLRRRRALLEDFFHEHQGRRVVAQIHVGPGQGDAERVVARREAQGLAVLGHGLAQLPRRREQLRQMPAEGQIIGREGQGLAEGTHGFIVGGHDTTSFCLISCLPAIVASRDKGRGSAEGETWRYFRVAERS